MSKVGWLFFCQAKISCSSKYNPKIVEISNYLKIQIIKTISDEIENNLDIYLKLFILLYADDTALLAETAIFLSF
jgi:hypothetical protein